MSKINEPLQVGENIYYGSASNDAVKYIIREVNSAGRFRVNGIDTWYELKDPWKRENDMTTINNKPWFGINAVIINNLLNTTAPQTLTTANCVFGETFAEVEEKCSAFTVANKSSWIIFKAEQLVKPKEVPAETVPIK